MCVSLCVWASLSVSESMCMSLSMAKHLVSVYECEKSGHQSVGMCVCCMSVSGVSASVSLIVSESECELRHICKTHRVRDKTHRIRATGEGQSIGTYVKHAGGVGMRTFWGLLGPLGGLLAPPRASWGLLGLPEHPGASWGFLGPESAH